MNAATDRGNGIMQRMRSAEMKKAERNAPPSPNLVNRRALKRPFGEKLFRIGRPVFRETLEPNLINPKRQPWALSPNP